MPKTMRDAAAASALLVTIVVAVTASPTPSRVSARHASWRCAPAASGQDVSLLALTRSITSSPAAAEFREELQLAPWPADSVRLVNDEPLCQRVDSLIMAWLTGRGAGKLVGVGSTVGPLRVARAGPSAFIVQPSDSVPPQPVPQYPYFVVDTAAPVRVHYFGAAP